MGLPENRVPKYVMINHLFPTRWVTNFQTRKKIMLKHYDPPFSSLNFPSKPPFSSGISYVLLPKQISNAPAVCTPQTRDRCALVAGWDRDTAQMPMPGSMVGRVNRSHQGMACTPPSSWWLSEGVF